MGSVDLVVFDLGSVLMRSGRSFREVYLAAGYPPNEALDSGEFDSAHESLVTALCRGTLAFDQYYDSIADVSRGALTRDTVEAILRAWIGDEYEGIAEVFDVLEAADVDTAILSNTHALHWDVLLSDSKYPNVRRAKYLFASHLLGLVKPEPAIFEAVTTATRREPKRVLFFDDGGENVRAAAAMGWRAERVDPLEEAAPQLFAGLRKHGAIA